MTDFDILLKEKTEQANYPFKHSAWKHFAKKAGVKAGLSAAQIIAIVASTVVVAGGVVWAVFRHQPISQEAEPKSVPSTVCADTLSPITEEPVKAETVEHKTTPSHKVQANKTKTVAPKEKDTVIEKVKPTIQSKTVKKPEQKSYGRPVIINVDTITQMVPTDEQLRKGNSRIF